MGIVDIVRYAALAGLVGVTVLYVLDARREPIGQAFLCALLPFYVVYYAFIKSRRSLPFRLALVICVILAFVPGGKREEPTPKPVPAKAG